MVVCPLPRAPTSDTLKSAVGRGPRRCLTQTVARYASSVEHRLTRSKKSPSVTSRLRLGLAVTLLAAGTTGCIGLDLALCCLSCATGGVVAAPNDGFIENQDEQHPEFMAKMKQMQAMQY